MTAIYLVSNNKAIEVGNIYINIDEEDIKNISEHINDKYFEVAKEINNTEHGVTHRLNIIGIDIEHENVREITIAEFKFPSSPGCTSTTYNHRAFFDAREIAVYIVKSIYNLDAEGDIRLTIDFDEKQGTFTANWNPARYNHNLKPRTGGMNFGPGSRG